ncbi:MAG: PEFG-CTERM sorting domain-containing protein [Nitrosopumilaceae archaeon]|nr:PEFG-CTERM sorting domain-containing protein [Nitrosopumilaceae archaeon]
MKKTIVYFVISFLIVSTVPAFGQEVESLISVDTDKAAYTEGETIVISGDVTTVIVNEPLTLQIFHAGNVVEIAQFEEAQDGSFTHTIIAEGPLWKNDGEYVVRVYYGGDISEATFEFSTKKQKPETTNIFEVDAGSYGTFDVEYTIKGGEVERMVVDPEIFGLIVVINSTDDGTISLDLPRDFIDAKTQDGKDDRYIVLIDGMEVVPQETKEDDSRILTIAFEGGDSDIEIIGTFVVPEFGTIMTLILLVGITSIIILSKNRMSIRI